MKINFVQCLISNTSSVSPTTIFKKFDEVFNSFVGKSVIRPQDSKPQPSIHDELYCHVAIITTPFGTPSGLSSCMYSMGPLSDRHQGTRMVKSTYFTLLQVKIPSCHPGIKRILKHNRFIFFHSLVLQIKAFLPTKKNFCQNESFLFSHSFAARRRRVRS